MVGSICPILQAMKPPQVYQVAGRLPDGLVTYYLLARDSTAAYHIAIEFWPELQIRGIKLLDEWTQDLSIANYSYPA